MPDLLSNAPDFSGSTVNGMGRFTLSEQVGSSVVIAFAGLTWCGPCIREAPVLQRLWEVMGPEGVQFVMISRGDPLPDLQTAIIRFGITFPVIQGFDATSIAYDVMFVPTLFVLTRDHRIHTIHVGALPGSEIEQETRLRREITAAMNYPSQEQIRGCAMVFVQFINLFRSGRITIQPQENMHDERSPMT